MENINVKALAHITGGGLLENIPRVMPSHTKAVISKDSWQFPPIFQWLQQQGNVKTEEMYRTFNCGIGMVICVAPSDVAKVTEFLQQAGEQVFNLGNIEAHDAEEPVVDIH